MIRNRCCFIRPAAGSAGSFGPGEDHNDASTPGINVLAAFGVWTPTPEQLAAVNSPLAAIFALLIRATVGHRHGTPVQLRRARPRQARKPAPPPETEPA